ncbi:MAG: tetratricopeptide repeat protein [Candidatus Rokubacteria bacterium]|nr:tetratricopeptide repeat protein [Candidatus Rokubacteria bacterium]
MVGLHLLKFSQPVGFSLALGVLLGVAGAACTQVPSEGKRPGPQERARDPQRLQAETAMEEARRLNLQVLDLVRQERHAAAIPLIERVLEIFERVLGPEHPDAATTLDSLARLHTRTGNYGRAELLYQRALEMQERRFGPGHPDVATLLDHFAGLYESKGDYKRAEALRQRALGIRERLYGPEHPHVAASLERLGALYQDTGDYKRAEALYQRVLAIRERLLGPAHPHVATALNNLAGLYSDTGDYGRAEALFRRALGIFEERVRGREGLEHVATALRNLASLYRRKGDYGRAAALSQQALEIVERLVGSEHPQVVDSLESLAEVYRDMGDYGRAEALYQRALGILERAFGPEHRQVSVLLANLAALYQVKGDPGRAAPLLLRALAIVERAFGSDHLDVASVLNNLGALHLTTGDYPRAEPLLQRAVEIRERKLGPEHTDVAGALHTLAALYEAKGEPGRAEALDRRGLDIQERQLGPEHLDVARSLDRLATVYAGQGDVGRAEPLYQRALEIRERVLSPEHPDVAFSLARLAALRETSGDVAHAVALRERGNDVRERALALVLSVGSEEQKRAHLAALDGETSRTVSLHAGSAPHDPRALRLALTTVLRRKGRVLDAMTDTLAGVRRRLLPENRALLDEWITARAELAAATLKGPGAGTPGAHRERLAGLAARAEQLEARLSSGSAEIRAAKEPVTLERVRQAMPPEAALLEIVVYEPFDPRARTRGPLRYVVYIVRREGDPAWVDLGEVAAIERAAADLRAALSNPDHGGARRLGRALDELVMRPIRPLLQGARMLLVSPDSALHLVPFGALVDEGGRYLVERASFIYLTTGRDLLRLAERTSHREPPLVAADPDFDDAGSATARAQVAAADRPPASRRSADFPGGTFRPLPGTAGEAAALRGLLPAARVLTRGAATETALKQAEGPLMLHVATHGFFLADQRRAEGLVGRDIVAGLEHAPASPPGLGENPLLRSGLALAGANRLRSGDEDGVLTALEAAGLDLAGTKLVVLSACETGVGAVQTGEGVYGLRRALVMAGAESQVMSLWKVADEATRDLMASYYRSLIKGEGRAEALRRAQLETLATADRSHPFFWAGFIPIGDWTPIDGLAAAVSR